MSVTALGLGFILRSENQSHQLRIVTKK